MNNDSMTLGAQVPESLTWVTLAMHPEEGLLGSHANPILMIPGMTTLFPTVAVPSPTVHGILICLHLSSACCLVFRAVALGTRSCLELLLCTSLSSHTEHLLTCFLAIAYLSLRGV